MVLHLRVSVSRKELQTICVFILIGGRDQSDSCGAYGAAERCSVSLLIGFASDRRGYVPAVERLERERERRRSR